MACPGHFELPPRELRHRHDELISISSSVSEETKLQRASATYKCQDDKFIIGKRIYERQYAQLYFARLMTLGPVVLQQAQAKWPGAEVRKILHVSESQEHIVVGTLYKSQKLKPSVLDEYTKDRGTRAALDKTQFCDESDTCVLEDEGARMVLGGVFPVQELVTGVVVAVRGMAQPGGDFIVSDMCVADLAPQKALPALGSDKYVALLGGLALSKSSADLLQVQLAVDWLTGALGGGDEQHLAASVVRVVVAGGSVGALEQLAQSNPYSRQHSSALQPIKDLDMFLAELAAALPVDVMPGPSDPANVALPQQPLHRCLLPAAASSGALTRVTNPHSFEVDGVSFLGTSGQNVDDMAKYCRQSSRLSMLTSCLRWRHLAPTAPDTLACYPFYDTDPFVITETPHVAFVANQPSFETEVIEGPAGQRCLVVCLPNFWSSGTLVLVNARTLQVHPMTFNSGMMKA